MATADEILSTMAEDTTDHTAVCEIDFASRVINIPSSISVLGVENDDDVRRINFIMPCTYGECDLNGFEININYLNANNEPDIYTVEDMAHVDNAITFSWLVGRTAVAYKGFVKFIVCLKQRDDTATVVKELNTTVATLEVLEGLEVGNAIAEQNPDAIEAILVRLNKVVSDDMNIKNGIAPHSLRLSSSKEESNFYSIGESAVAIGKDTEAHGKCSFAEGEGSRAYGDSSHAEGGYTIADGASSHAEGMCCEAKGLGSHAEGINTYAMRDGSHVQGTNNIKDEEKRYLHIVGNGATFDNRSNAHTIDADGNAWFAGNVYVGNANQDDGDQLLTMKDILDNVICIVNMTAEADDTMSTFTFLSKDKTFTNVKRVFDNGGIVACRVRWTSGTVAGMTMEAQLVSYASDDSESAFVFAFGANPMIMFKSDDTVVIENS